MLDFTPKALTEKVIKLEPIPGQKIRNTAGNIDNRLFQKGEGANRLRALQDPQTCLWSVKYDLGAVPYALKELKWTSFKNLERDISAYYEKRGVRVVGTED